MSTIFIGKDTDGKSQELLLNRANRHGLIAGATGTGKTVTLQILTEGFSKAGVPVFCADVKGDLSGLSQSGSEDHKLHDKLMSRSEKIGLNDYSYANVPVTFWDLFGEKGHPIRATIAEMGPMLLSRLMELTDAQEGIMTIVFDVAEDHKWPLLDMKDLRAVLTYVSDNRKDLSVEYGNITTQSVGAIMRNLLVLEREGANEFFGEPALDLKDMIRRKDGQGIVNILAADTLINSPRLYAIFLLWMLSEVFEELPEVGDPDKPVMAFFFDEAHLLFEDAPKALIQKIKQVSRLIRSKGVSLWFVTQNPSDIPDGVLSQIGNRIQHALRGYTPKEQKAIQASAEAFRPNPNFTTTNVISALGVGEALVSVLDAKAIPQIVGQTLIRPPSSRLGPVTVSERSAILRDSDMGDKYDEMIDRKSAEEMLQSKRDAAVRAQEDAVKKSEKQAAKDKKKPSKTRKSSGRKKKSAGDHIMHEVKLVGRQLMRAQGRKLIRGILGSVMRR
ncbi:MAG: helicase HerA-like domain-containing protein [Maricaulaceae bacterium]